MRSRNLKAGFFGNPVLNRMPADYRLLFLGLPCLADRRGLVEDRPMKIKDGVLRGLDTDTNAALDALSTMVDDDGTTLITRYVGANGVRTIKINKFLQHNSPHVKEPENPKLCDVDGSAGKAQCKHSASTVQAPDMHGASTLLTPRLLDSCATHRRTRASARCGLSADAGDNPDPEASGDPGDGTLDPQANAAAVGALLADTGAALAMTAAEGAVRPAAERRPDPDPMPQQSPDRGTAPSTGVGGEARAAARRLAMHIAKLDPACSPNDVQLDLWAQHIARLAIRDGRPWPEIAQVMAWTFEVSDWWPAKILGAADFARHYAKLRASCMAHAAAECRPAPEADASPETMRSLYATLESELADDGEDAARAWVSRQKPNLRPRLAKRLDKLAGQAVQP